MFGLFNKQEADELVINTLLKEISELRGEEMFKIIKSVEGKYYLMHNWEELTQDEVNAKAVELQNEVTYLQGLDATPEAPADIAVAAEETIPVADQPTTEAAVPEAPAEPTPPVDNPVPSPDQTPTDQTVAAPVLQ